MKDKIRELFKKERYLIILSSADEDSLASGIILKRILQSYKKQVKAIHYFPIPKRFLFIPYIEEIDIENPINIDYTKFDVVITVDAGSLKQIMPVKSAETFTFPNNVLTLSIDHHLANTHYAQYYIYNPQAASTAELIFEHFVQPCNDDVSYMTYDLNSEEATALLIGIIGDTGFFKWNMNVKLLRITERLLEKGANNLYITNYVSFSKDFRLHAFLEYTIHKIVFYPNLRFSLLALSQEDVKAMHLDLKDVHLFTRPFHEMFTSAYEGYDYGGVLLQGENEIIGSFRGNPYLNKVDLSALCQEISKNGGGHFNSAGFVLANDTDLKLCKKRVLIAVRKVYTAAEKKQAKDGI